MKAIEAIEAFAAIPAGWPGAPRGPLEPGAILRKVDVEGSGVEAAKNPIVACRRPRWPMQLVRLRGSVVSRASGRPLFSRAKVLALEPFDLVFGPNGGAVVGFLERVQRAPKEHVIRFGYGAAGCRFSYGEQERDAAGLASLFSVETEIWEHVEAIASLQGLMPANHTADSAAKYAFLVAAEREELASGRIDLEANVHPTWMVYGLVAIGLLAAQLVLEDIPTDGPGSDPALYYESYPVSEWLDQLWATATNALGFDGRQPESGSGTRLFPTAPLPSPAISLEANPPPNPAQNCLDLP
ncbi:MAG: hypothetical protein M0Z91_14550 [Actinomycetota bacterium]|nr:hypothetical protein [Actinomycetota bacterium]